MNKFFWGVLLTCSLSHSIRAQQVSKGIISSHHLLQEEIRGEGIISEKIYLKQSSAPLVRIYNIQTRPVSRLPEGRKAAASFEPDVLVTTERKKPVAFITLPAYRKSADGQLEQIVSYDLEVTESPLTPTGGGTAQRPTAVDNSVLQTGAWYKISVPHKGIFKLDYKFLENIGADPSSINPANIRIYGNGGTVLPERVSHDQPDDLIENAIFVQSSGSSFGPGDYVLFYANGPVLWTKDSFNQKFTHTNNYYADHSYYFLNFDLGPGKRIRTEAATGSAATNIFAFNDYAVVDVDSFNVTKIGKQWWGYRMNSASSASLTQSFQVNLGEVENNVLVEAVVGNINDATGNRLQLNFNGQNAYTFNLGKQSEYYFMASGADTFTIRPTSPNVNVQLRYLPAGTGTAYLDYLRFNYLRNLSFPGGQLSFRAWKSIAADTSLLAAYHIQNAPAATEVWEVTQALEPVRVTGTLSGSTYSFARKGNRLREFIAFDGTQFTTPGFVEKVANQNLHSLPHTDYLIITRNDLLSAAEELAAFHRSLDNKRVTVVTIDKIYNEFSSGSPDIGGIRNFIKMFYDKADNERDRIKNVLMLGAASFDYKDRIPVNSNIVPTFETTESIVTNRAYSSDDYFALLDEGELVTEQHNLDIGIGRIPAYNLADAHGAVQKIKNYASSNSFGPWKNVVTYVADDAEDYMNHLDDCETVNGFFQEEDKLYNLQKIYSDTYPITPSPGGNRYPAVNKGINDQIYNGTFLMSYSGHGSPSRWSHEAILTEDDYGSWTNANKLPIMVTATCDFGRFDDPTEHSAGAKLMLNPKGGSIAMITTTQVVYPGPNTGLNKAYVKKQFLTDTEGKMLTLGEALAAAKNSFGGGDNDRKFVVLGDPALRPQIPVHRVKTLQLSMLSEDNQLMTDTIKALGRYILEGAITDKNDVPLTDFNGEVYITIYDKIRTIQTVNQHPKTTASYQLQTNIVARIKAAVENGHFEARFIAPKDIIYDYGLGKISYYAHSDLTDAAGLDTTLTVGGLNPDAIDDNNGPVVEAFIDNEKFRDGGVTGPNPLLYVKLFDDNGINVSGTSVGHDLIAILDDNVQQPYVMNNFYQSEKDDYRKGFVNFPLANLPDGMHTIRVKAWDVYNNSGEGTVTFEVKNKEKGFISDLYNYPNPVRDITHIVFQHNQEKEEMEATLRLFAADGRLVRTIQQTIQPEGNRSEMIWDGKDDRGAPLFPGMYFYKLHLKTTKGIKATAYQKLVLLR